MSTLDLRRVGAMGLLAATLAACGTEEELPASATTSTTVGSGGAGGSPEGGGGGDGPTPAADPVSFRETGSMNTARVAHTATVLDDGRVLVVGGELANRDMIASVEIFDPSTETWTELSPLPEPRSNHIAVLLPNGKVLVAGGGRSAPIGQPAGLEVTASALLFDPSDGSFSPTGSMAAPRSHFQAVLLPSGRVLAMGGGADTHEGGGMCNGVPNCGPLADALATVEVYDPATGDWVAEASMSRARYSFTATLLASGEVVAAGGVDEAIQGTRSAELFDPAAGTWTALPDMTGPNREHHSATLLGSGRVLVAGGKNPNVIPLDSVSVFDATAPGWTAGPDMSGVRTVPGLVTLQSGRALLVGGFDQLDQKFVDEAALFDEATWAWVPIGPLDKGRSTQATTVLSDGSVLVSGGFTSSIGASARCEISVAP